LQQKLKLLKQKGYKTIPEPLTKKLIAQFAYIPCIDIHNEPWQIKNLHQFYKHNNETKNGLSFTRAAKLAGLTREEIKKFKTIAGFNYIKDMRDVYRRQGVYFSRPLFIEISRRLGLNIKQISFCSRQETINCLNQNKKFAKDVANNRTKGYLFYGNPNHPNVSTNKKLISTFSKKVSKYQAKSNIVKGLPASKGKVTGKVKIVLSVKDLNKVKRGDIIVAISTHPDFVPAMQKAKAIVTNEGAINSHAAIVSRELGIPCIVGTKIATRVFKDGDVIEVNANEGTVKKIS
jgi:phosphohistidine swiveling domain-containing protein